MLRDTLLTTLAHANRSRGAALLLLAALAAGAPSHAEESAPAPAATAAPEQAGTIALGDELGLTITFGPTRSEQPQPVRPRDVLSIVYLFEVPDPTRDYRAEVGDSIYLDFRYSPELSQIYMQQKEERIAVLSRAYIVQPNGTIALRGLQAPLHVADHTSSEITTLVTEAYKGLLQVPEVTVGISPGYLPEDRFGQALGENLGPLRVRVPEDGRLALPAIGAVDTRGKTVEQLSREMTAAYRKRGYRRLDVTAVYQEIADERHAQLRETLTPGQPLHLRVDAAGQVTPPLLAPLTARGKTPAQLAAAMTQAYHERGIERAQADLSFAAPHSISVQVLGGVRQPGHYTLSGRTDLWSAIAHAGGFAGPNAHPSVFVFDTSGKRLGLFDYQQFTQGNADQNLQLHGDELLVVSDPDTPTRAEQP